jgi:hypothetical protein
MNTIFSKTMWKKFLRHFFICLGVISGIIQIITFSFSNLPSYGWSTLFSAIFISIVIAVILAWPKNNFSESFSNPDVKIGIKVGNIFDQKGHLVIGFSDTFDTEIGEVISNTSLQGQFLMSMYENNKMKLDSDLDALLQNEESSEDPTKTRGKNKRYKIGTVVALNGQNRKFFCCAYSRMGSDLKATSDINNLWVALQNLWIKIRQEGEQKTIVLPVIGTNLAKVGGITYKLPIDLILLSFIINSRVEPISKELVLMIREQDKGKINMLEIRDFLKSLHN